MASFTKKGLPLIRGETLEKIFEGFEKAPDFQEYLLEKIGDIAKEDPGVGIFLAEWYMMNPVGAYAGTLLYLALSKEMEAAWEKAE